MFKILDNLQVVAAKPAGPPGVFRTCAARYALLKHIIEHPDAVESVKQQCLKDPTWWFDMFMWTYNPRCTPPVVPFILRPKQRDVVHAIADALKSGGTIVVDKSRDEGATEIMCKLLFMYWLWQSEFYVLVASHKEELVDKHNTLKDSKLVGSKRTLFAKMLECLLYLPRCMLPEIDKTYLCLQNLDNGSVIQGESTNPDLGIGGRFSAVFVDELCRVEPKLAETIIQNLPDTTKTLLYNSSLGRWGAEHPYCQLMESIRSGAITGKVVTLDWSENPVKSKGLYISPKVGYVRLLDKPYWAQQFPPHVWKVIADQEFNYDQAPPVIKSVYPFIADGGVSTFGKPRSIWLDEEERRRGNRVDLALNVLRIPLSGDQPVYDPVLVQDLLNATSDPICRGNFLYEFGSTTNLASVYWQESEVGLWSWWKPWTEIGRCIISADISEGTGNSDSVLMVIDRATATVIGVFASNSYDPFAFADLTYAACSWLRNSTSVQHWPLLIWELNGPGRLFARRIDQLNYPNRWQRCRRVPSTFGTAYLNYGFITTDGPKGSKQQALLQLGAAAKEGLKTKPLGPHIRIPCRRTVEQMQDFVWDNNRIVCPTGAHSGGPHGDRVMALAIGLYALRYEGRGAKQGKHEKTDIDRWIEHCRARHTVGSFEGKFLHRGDW